MSKKLSLILFSGTVDKMMAASVIASGAVAMNMDVDIYATFYGLNSLRKDVVGTNMKFSKDFEEMSGMMIQLMQQKHMPTWYETLMKAKQSGNVKVHGCTMTADLMGLKKENFDPIVDDMCGVGTYIENAQKADVTLFI